MQNWVAAHIADARALGKPLILSEFGHSALPDLSLMTREAFFRLAFTAIESSIAAGQPGAGDMFWHFYSSHARHETAADQARVPDARF